VKLAATAKALRKTIAIRHRAEAVKAREDTRDWAVQRRERTRHLIQLGGLVQKAGLIELSGDDRAVLFGGLVILAENLAGPDRENKLELFRRHGRRAFEALSRDQG
jgi:Conjugal transfer protein TraD